ncbi:hypothetical protein CMQ_978 [Grosmannia clavigera kw1407]|uniref:Uncharacterized protein n=1 Tax=Grosmannia clavigera (strain kw1407 / UAMH 11150) TaxID=655863 RepID=F0XDL7_GROCL|nr:uncharacterized protein CMQ_978 [Grosmannia clavigera kw1407]EFX04050.1 hypothetical protein CMQ_978 [Grosmannia clavigera kw1407]
MNSEHGHASVPRRPSFARKTRSRFCRWGKIEHGSLGSFSLGKVLIDCKLRCGECQWGTLGEPATPAGIIYVDLSFIQPEKYTLASASVCISFEDYEEHEERPRSHRRGRRSKEDVRDAMVSRLAVTEKYGPKMITGTPSTRKEKTTINATPEFGAGGCSIGGIGFRSEKTTNRSSRWILSSQPLAGRSRHGIPGVGYNTIIWNLEENDLIAQPLHSNVFHTGLAITHEARPFYIKVQIAGKLRKLTDRLKYQFPARAHQEEGIALTLVNLGPEHQSEGSLDSVAEGLATAMKWKNEHEVASVMPDSQSDISFSSGTRTLVNSAADATLREEPPVGLPSSPSSSLSQRSTTDTLLGALDMFSASEKSEIRSDIKQAYVSPATAELQKARVSISPSDDALKEEAAMVEERLRRLSEYPTVVMMMHLLTLLLDALNPVKPKLKRG